MKDTNLLIGKKNTGKTRNILFKEVEKAIQNGENVLLYNDRKEYYQTFSKRLQENGYHVWTLNLEDVTKSNGFNPLLLPYLLYKEGKKDEAVHFLYDLAEEIFKEDTATDPFWENMASSYFTGLALILFKEAKEEEVNLGSVQIIMCQGENEIGDTTRLKQYLKGVEVTNPIYVLLSPIVFAPPETKGSILSVTKQKLNQYLLREQLLNLLNTNEINLNDIQEKTAFFIIGAEGLYDLANIFINQVIHAIKKPFTFVFDNFDSLRKLGCFHEFMKNASYLEHKVYVAVHNEEAFKAKYGKYITDEFEEVERIEENTFQDDMATLGNDEEYPNLAMHKHNYFSLEKFLEK